LTTTGIVRTARKVNPMRDEYEAEANATDKRIRVRYLSNPNIPVEKRIKAVMDEHIEWLKITRDQDRLTDQYLEIERENVTQELQLVFSTIGFAQRRAS
jgi:hypothetical protein